MRERSFGSFAEVRSLFPHVSRVGQLTIFNIAGNNVRLIVSMRYGEGRVYIRHVLTHAEYDKEKWRE
jgi:mRNA interferase HigB